MIEKRSAKQAFETSQLNHECDQLIVNQQKKKVRNLKLEIYFTNWCLNMCIYQKSNSCIDHFLGTC